MKKMQKSDWVLTLIILVMINIMSLWCIDISVSAMLINVDVMVTNGFFDKSPIVAYHMGLYGVILSMLGIIMIAISILLKEKEVIK